VKPLGDTRLSRVWVPPALAESGSDIPRACLTRLRCASRVSHPPDALFPPKPFRPISDGNAPGILPFEGFPFRVLGSASRPTLPAWRWLVRPRRLFGWRRLARLPGDTLRESPWPPSLQAAGVARSSPELSSPPGVILPLRRPRSSRVPPPMDFDRAGGEPSTVSGPPECRSKRA
jgi:hypothetical protein